MELSTHKEPRCQQGMNQFTTNKLCRKATRGSGDSLDRNHDMVEMAGCHIMRYRSYHSELEEKFGGSVLRARCGQMVLQYMNGRVGLWTGALICWWVLVFCEIGHGMPKEVVFARHDYECLWQLYCNLNTINLVHRKLQIPV